MTIEAFNCYQLYTALKLHFTTPGYDFFKYLGKTRVSPQSFRTRKDHFFFKKLAQKFANEEQLQGFFVANFLAGEKWIGNMTTNNHQEWLSRIESLRYRFTTEIKDVLTFLENHKLEFNSLFTCESGEHPFLFKMYRWKNISIETLIILNEVLTFVPRFDIIIVEKVLWPEVRMLILKYRPFLDINIRTYKRILKDVVQEWNTS